MIVKTCNCRTNHETHHFLFYFRITTHLKNVHFRRKHLLQSNLVFFRKSFEHTTLLCCCVIVEEPDLLDGSLKLFSKFKKAD